MSANQNEIIIITILIIGQDRRLLVSQLSERSIVLQHSLPTYDATCDHGLGHISHFHADTRQLTTFLINKYMYITTVI
jgi:hypothetical protein